LEPFFWKTSEQLGRKLFHQNDRASVIVASNITARVINEINTQKQKNYKIS
jgi:hypothetical protein